MLYATEKDLLTVFGKTNISQWANIENLSTPNAASVKTRINYYLELATEMVDNRLRERGYTHSLQSNIPDGQDQPTTPKVIVHLATLIAGVSLFDTRAINYSVDQAEYDISSYRQQIESIFYDIDRGVLRLGFGWSCPFKRSPEVIATNAANGVKSAVVDENPFNTCGCKRMLTDSRVYNMYSDFDTK